LSAEYLEELAKNAYAKKEYRQAALHFAALADEYAAKGDILAAAEMKNNCSVAWLQAGEAQKSLACASETDQVFAEAGDSKREAMALGNQAAALEALGNTQEAISRYEAAAEIFGAIHEQELRAYVLQSLSALQLKSGDNLQSLASMHAALENKQKPGLREKLLRNLLRVPFKMLRK
jgi:tetratricopeptide (TPR) repeat protein